MTASRESDRDRDLPFATRLPKPKLVSSPPESNIPAVKVGVVLAAGRSERLTPVTAGHSKALLRVGDIPLIARAIETLTSAGIERVLVVVGHDAEEVAEEVANLGAEAVLAEDWASGNGASLAAVADHIGTVDPFLVMCGDHLFGSGALDKLVRSAEPAVLIDESPDQSVWDEGTRVRVVDGRALEFNKALPEVPVDCGVFVLPADVFEAQRVAATEGDNSLAGAVTRVATNGIRAIPIGTWWQDVDTTDDLRAARHRIRRSLTKKSDGHVSRYLNRPISTRITMALARWRVAPNHLSLATASIGFLAAWLLATGHGLAGGALVQLASVFDGTDGETARLHNRATQSGARLDAFLDRAVDGAVYAGLWLWAWGGANTGTAWWIVPLVAVSWAAVAISLQGPVEVFEIPRSAEPLAIVLLGGRDARMLLIALLAATQLPAVAFVASLATFGAAAAWRVGLVLSGRRHPQSAPLLRAAVPDDQPLAGGEVPAVAEALPDTDLVPAGSRTGLAALRRIVGILLFPAALLAAFFGVMPRLVDVREVWAIITALPWTADVLLGLLAVANLVTYWPFIMRSMPGLSLRQAAVACQSSTSVAMTVPAGGALAVGVSYSMYTSWGFSGSSVASSALATFVVGTATKLFLPLVALVALLIEGQHIGNMAPAAVVGLVALAATVAAMVIVARGESAARQVGSVVGRMVNRVRTLFRKEPLTGWENRAASFHAQLGTLLRTRWRSLSATSLISQLSVFAVMLAAVRLTGMPSQVVSVAEALAVFAAVRLASSVPIVPGNAGFAELGYIGGLVIAGGGRTEAVAAVLLFRFLTYYAQIPLGGLTFLAWRRERRPLSVEPLPA